MTIDNDDVITQTHVISALAQHPEFRIIGLTRGAGLRFQIIIVEGSVSEVAGALKDIAPERDFPLSIGIGDELSRDIKSAPPQVRIQADLSTVAARASCPLPVKAILQKVRKVAVKESDSVSISYVPRIYLKAKNQYALGFDLFVTYGGRLFRAWILDGEVIVRKPFA